MARHCGLVSVGYEGRTIDQLIEILVAERVDVLADVRLTPLSRKPGLSKTRLAERLDEVGIRYVHFRGLGNPKDNRAAFGDGRIEAGIARFRALLRAPDRMADLDRLAELAENNRVAVLCFERDHGRCHRQVLTDEVVNRSVAAPAVAMA